MHRSESWRVSHMRVISTLDAFVIAWAVAGAFIVRFRWSQDIATPSDEGYAIFAVCVAVAWWVILRLWGSADPRVLGTGSEEYKRILTASAWLFGGIAIISYALQAEIARGFVGLAFPAGVLGLLLSRWLLRQHLSLQRRHGKSASRVLVISGPHAANHLIRSLRSAPEAGYLPVAAHLPGSSPETRLGPDIGVPITGVGVDIESILSSIATAAADAVAISAGVQMRPETIRRLGWELAARDVGMILAPALTDIAGPRIHTQPVAGLPLIHVSTPKLSGGKRVAKRGFDVLASGFIILMLLPVMAIVAILVRMSSPGPIFYSQDRIGLQGTTFKMLKFRSMRVNADAELQALLTAQGTSNKPLFKIENDPRITPVGRILRKFSLDELPQLLNVLQGEMSLVGPRPQREGEVALYDDAAHRRLYVRPGMSGLWQVSGRSNLTWDESIRLDLYYVENWSLTGDIVILLKTFKAVFASDGAV